MSVVASRPSVTTSATKIAENTSGDTSDVSNLSFVVKNITGTAAIFLGPSGVTTSSGFQWDVADGPLAIDLEPGESLYGIVASTSQTCHVLGAGR